MIKATVEEVRAAYTTFNRMFEEVKLGADAAWEVSRLTSKLKPVVKEFDKNQMKAYRDAGGMVDGRGLVLEGPERGKEESDDSWANRRTEHREKMNALHDEVQALLEKPVEIDWKPIKVSMLPKKRKERKEDGKIVDMDIEYRGTDFANAGPFLIDDSEPKE